MEVSVINSDEGLFKVTSARDESKFYEVQIDPRVATCTCPHFKLRCARSGLECKHILAVRAFEEAEA